jgi:hypothetical protein
MAGLRKAEAPIILDRRRIDGSFAPGHSRRLVDAGCAEGNRRRPRTLSSSLEDPLLIFRRLAGPAAAALFAIVLTLPPPAMPSSMPPLTRSFVIHLRSGADVISSRFYYPGDSTRIA